MARLLGGDSLALISDAGTPLLSDPGSRLVRAVVEAGLIVSPVPGASALLAGLVASGLDVDRFTFVGFLPRKGGPRGDAIAELVSSRYAVVLYEAPSRVAQTLRDIANAGGGTRCAAVARELTKQFEETRRGTVADLAAYYSDAPPRGEIVMVIAGADVPVGASEEELRERAAVLRAAGHSAREVAAALTNEFGATRNLAYRLAHE